jgi:hypothetical protein
MRSRASTNKTDLPFVASSRAAINPAAPAPTIMQLYSIANNSQVKTPYALNHPQRACRYMNTEAHQKVKRKINSLTKFNDNGFNMGTCFVLLATKSIFFNSK